MNTSLISILTNSYIKTLAMIETEGAKLVNENPTNLIQSALELEQIYGDLLNIGS